jgi:hypothetical protein
LLHEASQGTHRELDPSPPSACARLPDASASSSTPTSPATSSTVSPPPSLDALHAAGRHSPGGRPVAVPSSAVAHHHRRGHSPVAFMPRALAGRGLQSRGPCSAPYALHPHVLPMRTASGPQSCPLDVPKTPKKGGSKGPALVLISVNALDASRSSSRRDR